MGDALTPPLLTPLEPTTVELLTHTADFTLSAPVPSTAQNTIALQLAASYRFGNDGSEPVTVILKMAEQQYNGATPEIRLAVGDTPLTLFRTEGVGYTAQIQIGADARTTVDLYYTITVDNLPLPSFSYNAAGLSAWPGNPSVRVSVVLPQPQLVLKVGFMLPRMIGDTHK
ncbi:MAG: hypothetical protein R2932_32640 [Caldilineaceae bacterium]